MCRSLDLPAKVEFNKAAAPFREGIVEVTLPKVAAEGSTQPQSRLHKSSEVRKHLIRLTLYLCLTRTLYKSALRPLTSRRMMTPRRDFRCVRGLYDQSDCQSEGWLANSQAADRFADNGD